jgi:hypothetical protein
MYSHSGNDSKVILGDFALKSFNMFASPSAVLKEKTMYVNSATQFFEHLDKLIYSLQDPKLWKPFHVFSDGLHIRQGIFQTVVSDLISGEREEIPIIILKDYKKDITIKYSFTKIDKSSVNNTITITKKSLPAFLENLRLIADLNQPFSLYISEESLKNEYRTT